VQNILKKEPLMLTLSEVLSFLCGKVGGWNDPFNGYRIVDAWTGIPNYSAIPGILSGLSGKSWTLGSDGRTVYSLYPNQF
jgi:hypothetical protein